MTLLKNKNYAFSLLASGINAGDTSITVTTSEGALFPSTGSFMLAIWDGAIAAPALDANRELVEATFTSGDTFSITRAQEGTAAKSWLTGDNVALVITAGKLDELETAIQDGSISFAVATGTDTYALALDPALSSYTNGLFVKAKFNNACTGNSTLNINALGAKKIYKHSLGAYSLLASGDIIAGMFTGLFYDTTLDSGAGGWILTEYYRQNIINNTENQTIAGTKTFSAQTVHNGGIDCNGAIGVTGVATLTAKPVINGGGINDGTQDISFPTNNMAAAKFMLGNSDTITWFYLNTAPPGWKVLTTGADTVLGVSGGAGDYNVNGGNPDSGATWVVSGLTADVHTHSTTIPKDGWSVTSSTPWGTLGGSVGTASQNEGVTANRTFASGSASANSVTSNGTWRPSASVGKLFQLDTA